MPVNVDPISIDPYKSQVPLVQIPQEDLQRAQVMPEQAGYMGKAGAGMAIGDSLMKGVLKGLQMKEQKKYAQATATMNALDTTTNSAYENYQTLLAQGKQDEAKAAYDVYLKNFNDAKTAKAQFAIPDKKAQQGQKGKGKKDAKDENGVATAGGFGAGLKQFFERNPHVIPELALVAMQPKPPGPSIDTIQNQAKIKEQQQAQTQSEIQTAEMQRKQAAEKVYDTYSGLNSEEIAALPPEEKHKYEAAKNIVFPPYQTRTTRQYASPDGKSREWYIPGAEPEGWNAVATGSQTKPGTESEYTSQALKGYGFTAESAPAPLLKYLHDSWQWKNSQTTTGSHEVLQPDPVTHKMVAVQVGSSTTKGAPQPKPPTGFAPLDENGMPTQGGMQAPPQQNQPAAQKGGKTATGKMTAPPTQAATSRSAAPKTAGRGAMTPPPTGVKGLRNTGLDSMSADTNTQKVETEKANRYAKAEATHKAVLQKNQKMFEDRLKSLSKSATGLTAEGKKAQEKWLEDENAKATAALDQAKNEVGKWYQQQVHAMSGNVPEDNANKQPPPGATMVYKDKNGIVQGYAVNGQFVAAGSN
jgi:hypothetical protein